MLTGARRWFAPVLLGAIALVVRLAQLDHVPHVDELYHYLAAQSWLAEGELRIAEGVYERASLFTIGIAEWLRLFGESLVVARLPSLLAGVALVVLVYIWTRSIAGNLAAVVAALFVALDPEIVELNQLLRFYSLQCLFFWLGAIGTYSLVTSAPATRGRAVLLAAGTLICLAAAFYLQLTTLIGLVGLALWTILAAGLPWLERASPRARWRLLGGMALFGAAALWVLIESGLAGELVRDYRSTAGYLTHRRDEFWYYHVFLTIYYPTFWPLTALAVVIGLAYRPRPTAFCTCVVATAFVLHSFAGPKVTRYFSYAQPFLFVLWGIALAEIWPRICGFLEEVGTRALQWLRLGRLGRQGVAAGFVLVLLFAAAANGAFVRTVATMFGAIVPPMQRPADWAAAKDALAPWLTNAGIVLTTSELEALHHFGRYDVLISKTRQTELRNRDEFALDYRTGRPVVASPESIALIMDCYGDGLIVSSVSRWRQPAYLDDEIANLIEARAEPLDLPRSDMLAYVWQRPDDAARQPEACARLPAELNGRAVAGAAR